MNKCRNEDEQCSQASQEKIKEYRSYKFDAENNKFIEIEGIYSPSFPVVLKSDGTVWDKAALYLNYLLIKKKRSSKLLKNVADDLLDFLRFMENNKIDMLHAPDEEELRVTYRYRQHLLHLEKTIINNKKGIGRITASHRMNRIIAFYDYCFKNKLFLKNELKNRLYKRLKEKLWLFNDYGFTYQTEVETHNLKISRPPRNNQKSDSILDGRQLHPLTIDEQKIFYEYLRMYANRPFQLICSIAINTGARLQPICTLRVNDIKSMMISKNVKGNYKKLIVGGDSTTIDNKQGKKYAIFFPDWLVKQIDDYVESNEWRERAAKSYYKNNNNYVFLSKFGTPFYTSQQEKIDRANRVYQSDKVLVEKFGESVRKYLNDILKLMAQDNQPIRKFSIHDLRATFGLNLLNNLKDCNLSENEIMDEIRERMGHEKFKTTLNYLTYSARNEAYKRVSEKFSEVIYKFE